MIYNIQKARCFPLPSYDLDVVNRVSVTVYGKVLDKNYTRLLHDSKPYNPDIANVFYRAGFIENWGQGIQKICDECQGIGAEFPVYELVGTTLRIRFKALESALIDQPKVPKGQNESLDEPKEDLLAAKIIRLLRDNPKATYGDLVIELGVSRSTIKRAMGNLGADGHIVRVGGKRYGYWKINE